MAFDSTTYVNIIKRSEQDQSTVEGRLARVILVDSTWDFTAAKATQQTRVSNQFGNSLSKHVRNKDRGYDPATLQTIIGEWYTQAGG